MPTESLAELIRFAPDAYGFRWANHVALFIVTDAGVLLVDANGQVNPRTPSLIKEAIRSVTPQPVKYVVYSHSARSEEHTSELQSLAYLVCRLLLEKKKKIQNRNIRQVN